MEVYNDDLWLPIANYYDLWPTQKKTQLATLSNDKSNLLQVFQRLDHIFILRDGDLPAAWDRFAMSYGLVLFIHYLVKL